MHLMAKLMLSVLKLFIIYPYQTRTRLKPSGPEVENLKPKTNLYKVFYAHKGRGGPKCGQHMGHRNTKQKASFNN